MRFREYALNFKASDGTDDKESRDDSLRQYEYPSMTKTLEQFCLHVDGGCFRDSEIVVLLGENGEKVLFYVSVWLVSSLERYFSCRTMSLFLSFLFFF